MTDAVNSAVTFDPGAQPEPQGITADIKVSPNDQRTFEQEQFAYIRRNKTMSTLSTVKTEKEDITYNQTTAIIKKEGLLLSIRDYLAKHLVWSDITHKVLFCLMEEFTRLGAHQLKVEVDFDYYMKLRGLKDVKASTEQLDAEIYTLVLTTITIPLSAVTHKKDDEGTAYHLNILEDGWVKNGIIYATFTQAFMKFIQKASRSLVPFPKALLRINSHKHPNSRILGEKIYEMLRMNMGKPNSGIISTRALLAVCADIPSEDEVANTDRAYRRRIIEPFFRDLDALVDEGILEWELYHARGITLSDAELADLTYPVFIKTYIHITKFIYPNKEEAEAAAQKRNAPKKTRKPRKKKGAAEQASLL